MNLVSLQIHKNHKEIKREGIKKLCAFVFKFFTVPKNFLGGSK